MNYLRTAILLAGLTGLFMVVGYLIGGSGGAVIALIIAVATNLFSYWNADKLVLSIHDAQEVDERSEPEFVAIVQELAQLAGLPMPRVYLMDSPQANAFATGRNPQHAAVCATTGLLSTLSREEIAGVIGHELAHLRNHDTLTMTITATIAGAISMLAQLGMFFGAFGGNRDNNNNGLGVIGSLLMLILAPIAAMIVQMAISRAREYAAAILGRASAADQTRSHRHLSKSRAWQKRFRTIPPRHIRRPPISSLSIPCPVAELFSTHPSTENRVAALQRLSHEMGLSGFGGAPLERCLRSVGGRGRTRSVGTRRRSARSVGMSHQWRNR
jgi:heat shock protein HtpX